MFTALSDLSIKDLVKIQEIYQTQKHYFGYSLEELLEFVINNHRCNLEIVKKGSSKVQLSWDSTTQTFTEEVK